MFRPFRAKWNGINNLGIFFRFSASTLCYAILKFDFSVMEPKENQAKRHPGHGERILVKQSLIKWLVGGLNFGCSCITVVIKGELPTVPQETIKKERVKLL